MFFEGLDQTELHDADRRRCAVLALLLVLPRLTTPGAGGARRGRRQRPPSRRCSSSASHGVATVGSLPQGVPSPTLPVDERAATSGRC